MTPLDPQVFAATVALIGGVIIVAGLLSGIVERTGLPQLAVFLALGAALGPLGLGLVDIRLDDPLFRAVATLGLVLVLFTDAVGVDVPEVRRQRRLALLVLGPGTLLVAGLIAVAGRVLLGLEWPSAVILGAALASTDPVLMRGLLRRPDVPAPARIALRIESGLNDAVLLPIVLIAMAVLRPAGAETGGGGRLALELFLLGPGVGVAIGLAGVAMLDLVRRRIGMRRDYESLYALGIAFTAFAGAEAVHGSGFLAAFAAGLTVAAFDAELCDCFLDYGEATAEVFLLFTFVALGSSLIWEGLKGVSVGVLVFAVIALLARTVVLSVALVRERLDRNSRRLIVWFGPRGLSSLLLVLLAVFAGVPGSERLFAVTALVVLVSVVLHGGSLMLVGQGGLGGGGAGTATAPEPAARGLPIAEFATAPAPPTDAVADRERMTLAELRHLEDAGEPVVLVDVRKDRAWNESDIQARGAVRLPPDRARERAAELALPRHAWLVAYCA